MLFVPTRVIVGFPPSPEFDVTVPLEAIKQAQKGLTSICGGTVKRPDHERPVPGANSGRCVSAAVVAAEMGLFASKPMLMVFEATLIVVAPATGAIPLTMTPSGVKPWPGALGMLKAKVFCLLVRAAVSAFKSRAACVAVEIGLSTSLVFVTFERPT